MKIIAYTGRDEHSSIICELSRSEFELVTGKLSTSQYGGQLFSSGSKVEIAPLILRVRDALQVAGKLNATAEALRGMATVLDHIDALVPKAPEPE